MGNMTNAAVNNVTLSRMVSGSSRFPHFARHVPDLVSGRLRAEFSYLRWGPQRAPPKVGEDVVGRGERKLAGAQTRP